MILYEKGTTDFSRNGLGYLNNVINASVVEELNGEYSLTFDYPLDETLSNELIEERIVKCKVADGTNQCFIIKNVVKTYEKMTITCSHLFYLLLTDLAEDIYPQNLSPKPFLDWIIARANYILPFTTTSDISVQRSGRYIRKNLVEIILGEQENSMVNLFNLEIKRNNWNIALNSRIGADRGEKLLYGKNITGINITIDTSEMYTRIMPVGYDGLLLPEKYVDASNIEDYPYPKIAIFEFSNIRYAPNDEKAYHTLEEAYEALRAAVENLYANGINQPKINVKIDWLELSKTEEYKQYSNLERVELGDTIHAEIFGLNYTTRVIKTVYNPLSDRIEQFEIGTVQPSYASQMNKYEFELERINPASLLEEATNNATSLITQAMGGYVYKTNSELYIMDNEDPNQAVHVWRWNINGLGYSSTGINGTYGLAMTMDGQIVADFITTGQLSANVISAGTIIGVINGNTSQLKLDADQIDLTATDVLNILAGNQINLTSKNISINSDNFSVDSGGNMTCSNADITGGYITLTDNPSDPEDRFIIWASDRTRLTTATSEYVITRAWDDNNPGAIEFDYTQISKDSGVSWENYNDANNKSWGSCANDRITINKTTNGVTSTTQIRTSGSDFSGDVTINGNLYAPNTLCRKTMSSTNLNTIYETGMYSYDNGSNTYSNAPTTDGIHILTVYQAYANSTDWVVQEDYVLRYGASSIDKYIRTHTPTGWTSWQKII